MPGSDVPVIRQPFEPGDRLPFWVGSNAVDAHFLFDLDEDPGEDENLSAPPPRRTWWSCCVSRCGRRGPGEQLERLGIGADGRA